MQNTVQQEWDLKKIQPQFSDTPQQAAELKICRDVVKPAITLHQKISTFTLRAKFLRPVNGKMRQTGHSHLYEFDKDSRTVEHETAVAGLMNLVHRKYVNNIDKVILVENITDTIIWTYYGKLDRYPFQIKWHTTPEGDKIISEYNYYDWSKKEYVNVNIMRDYFHALQEKININVAWHKNYWREQTKAQVLRETSKVENPGKGSIESYNQGKLQMLANNLRAKFDVNETLKK